LRKQSEELKTLILIKDKLLRNKALITKADKGSSIVIIYQKYYEKKVADFILNNGADEINRKKTQEEKVDNKHKFTRIISRYLELLHLYGNMEGFILIIDP